MTRIMIRVIMSPDEGILLLEHLVRAPIRLDRTQIVTSGRITNLPFRHAS